MQQLEEAANADEPEKPQKKARPPKNSSAPQKRKASEAAKPAKKQAAAVSKPKARKRQKLSVSDDDNDNDEEENDAAVRSDASEPRDPAPRKPIKKSRVVEEDPEDEDITSPAPRAPSSRERSVQPGPADVSGDDTHSQPKPISPTKDSNAVDSDSDMSILIDEPPKTKRQKKTSSAKAKPTKPAASKSKSKEDKDVDPHEAEIKRLQGWLVKCGIRKLWGKELKPFDTPKAKANHLRDMLKDAGMDGRYSVEKARQIKERRELAADLEAVQEGAKRWGQSDSEDDGDSRPKRRLAKGLKDLEGLIESDGEETD